MVGEGLAVANPECREPPRYVRKGDLHRNSIGRFEWQGCFLPKAWTLERRSVLELQAAVRTRSQEAAGNLQPDRYKAKST